MSVAGARVPLGGRILASRRRKGWIGMCRASLAVETEGAEQEALVAEAPIVDGGVR